MKKTIVIAVLIITAVLSSNAQIKKVLFVMSAEDTLLLNKGKKERQTGVFLNEFYLAYKAIINEGYTVDFATPNGVKATIDLESLGEDYWEEKPELKNEALEFWNTDAKFSKPMTLEMSISNYDDYIGIVIPGGQGLMVDLIADTNIPVPLCTSCTKTRLTKFQLAKSAKSFLGSDHLFRQIFVAFLFFDQYEM
jgi:hypothetical protein